MSDYAWSLSVFIILPVYKDHLHVTVFIMTLSCTSVWPIRIGDW